MNNPRVLTYTGSLNRLLSLFGRTVLVTGLLIIGSNFSTGGENPNNFDIFEKALGVNNPANGSGVMVSGELWDSFQPANRGPYYSEASLAIPKVLVRVGNFDRAWTTPTHMWPGGWDRGAFWDKQIEATVWDPDPNFNPQTIDGSSNPSYTGSPNYAYLAYPNRNQTGTIPGKGDPNRDYDRETKWVDPQKRHHALYEAGWPTTVGVDVQMRIHQYSLNWNNFNDFIIVEFTLTNTGVVDQNADGTPELTNHVIEGLAMSTHGEYMSCYSLSRTGGRGNRFGATRTIGYIGDADPSGAPWNMHISYPGESGSGVKDLGLFDFTQRWYADVWSAWTFLGAKNLAGDDFLTRFGTHPVGVGAQRGWFTADGVGKGFSMGSVNAKQTFVGATGIWYEDGGRSRDSSKFDLAANSNFFQPGSTPGDLRTFVPLENPGQPNGDIKTTDQFEVNTYEPGWTKGFTSANNFDGDGFMGIGPFKLDVGQSVVVTWVTAGGFRLKGVANAIAAARWAYENNFAVPEPPAAPEMIVRKPLQVPMKIHWDNRAETHTNFSGYKIYRATDADTIDWLETGMRVVDHYWRSTIPGPTPDSLKEPINPNFGAQAFVANSKGVPNSWGPYQLIAFIPDSALDRYRDASIAGYSYAYEDSTVDLDANVWYYVAAYADGNYDLGSSFAGYGSRSTTRIESSNINRNGASGLWENTYPFADLNSFFPQTPAGRKLIGAAVRRSPLLAVDRVSFGAVSVGASTDRWLNVSNTADEEISATVTSTNPLFSTAQNQFAVGPGDSLELEILYSPVSSRHDTGMVLFSWNGFPYYDTVHVFGEGSGSGFYAQPVWEAVGTETAIISLPTCLASDQTGNVYVASMLDLRHFTLDKRSPSGSLYWTVKDSVNGSLPLVGGLHISPDFNVYVLVTNSPPQVRKFNSSGVLQWVWEYSAPSWLSSGRAMAVDTLDNIYVTGYVSLTSYDSKIFVAKINSSGQEEWSSMYDFDDSFPDSTDVATAIDVDDAGNIVVLGYTGGTFSSKDKDIVVFRCRPDGVMEWHDTFFNGGSNDEGKDVGVDREGNVYITGFTSPLFFGASRAITMRYHSNGTRDWLRVFPDGDSDSGSGNQLAIDEQGNVYVVGSSTLSGYSDSDYFTLRYDSGGNRTWVRWYDGSVGGQDAGMQIGLDGQENVYVSGVSLGSTGSDEIAAIKYSGSTGETVWETRYGRQGSISNTSMAVDPSGNLLVSGMVLDSGLRTVVAKYAQLAVPVQGGENALPLQCSLHQNYPNPFNPSTTITFSLSQSLFTSLKVYDILGREVATLVAEQYPAGTHKVTWDARMYASGVYFYRLQAGDFIQTRKLLLLR